jgi:hypothetical protein
MTSVLGSIGVIAVSIGCTPIGPPIPIVERFDAELARKYLTDGPNTIAGSAVIPQRGGGVVTCAGREVELIPATDYARARIRAIYEDENHGFLPASRSARFEEPPEEYLKLRRSTLCDAQGFFRFERVADGEFFVETWIIWHVSPYTPEGGGLMRRVAVNGGQRIDVVLSPLAR